MSAAAFAPLHGVNCCNLCHRETAVNAFFVVACASVNATAALSDVLAVGGQPSAYAFDVSVLLAAVLVVVMLLGTTERIRRGNRRARARKQVIAAAQMQRQSDPSVS